MQRHPLAKYLVGCLGVATIIGCAVGTDPGADVSDLAQGTIEAGPEETGATLPPTPPPTDQDSGVTPTDDSGTDPDASTPVDAGSDSGLGGGASCLSPNVCTGATDLGAISGDTGNDVKTAQGVGSQWLKVRVGENDNSVIGHSLSLTASLTSPAAANFDLYVYVAGGGSGQECSAVSGSSIKASGVDSVQDHWGEGTFSNGSDDGRTVTIEVRWKSGTCSAAAKWSLNVTGDTY